jgi:hypothetical protein
LRINGKPRPETLAELVGRVGQPQKILRCVQWLSRPARERAFISALWERCWIISEQDRLTTSWKWRAMGFVLVRREDHCDEFNRLVRELLNRNSEEFVILPVTDGGRGYDRAIILPI